MTKKKQVPQTAAASTWYLVAIVLIVAMGVSAGAVRPDLATAIFAFCGMVIVSLLAILKGQSEIHEVVNHKMDALLKTTAESEKAKGVLEGERKRPNGE